MGIENERAGGALQNSGERRFDQAPSAPRSGDELLEMALRKRRHASRVAVRAFEIIKIRTMRVDAGQLMADLLEVDDQPVEEFTERRKLRSDPRSTRTGSFLRRSRLEEIPQMLSVIKGDMSVVGPRPVVPSEIRRYGGFASIASSVKPDVAGLWQVSSSNADDYRERLFHDVSFATHHTFADVVRIAAKTPAVVIGSLGRKEFV